MSDQPILDLQDVRRTFKQAGNALEVLKGVDLQIESGAVVAMLGPSGAGKSTILHLAGLLERPTAGEVLIDGRACNTLSDRERTRLRRSTVGFVYQFHHLLGDFTALENVMMPPMLAGQSRAKAKSRAAELLDLLGLSDRLSHRPARLSGGEQQRVAIARALANEPKILLADEPTGNLDPTTAETVFALLTKLAKERGIAALIATHNHELAKRMDRIMVLAEGRLQAAA